MIQSEIWLKPRLHHDSWPNLHKLEKHRLVPSAEHLLVTFIKPKNYKCAYFKQASLNIIVMQLIKSDKYTRPSVKSLNCLLLSAG